MSCKEEAETILNLQKIVSFLKEQKDATHQIAYRQHVFKVGGHGVVLHGHEEGVEHDTDGDG